MPKIEVNEEVFSTLAGRRWDSREALEEALVCAKAELDSGPCSAEPVLKIELNDTNRPDLWSTAGCARQLRIYYGGKRPAYSFFSYPGAPQTADAQGRPLRSARVEASVQGVRPYLAGFVAAGKAVTPESLRDMIQTQEKLAWNYGRKRRTLSMGLYRAGMIQWPIVYRAADPDAVSFVPLQWDAPLTLREILQQHPKGREYAFIQEHEPLHPLLLDSQGNILSYPPIINSADIGAVQAGDQDLFVELTGTDQRLVTLAASIMACDMADQGCRIEPVRVDYEYDTPMGRSVTTPYYFQEPVFCSLARINALLGETLSLAECRAALEKMGPRAVAGQGSEGGDAPETGGLRVYPPEYRNDFLHPVDVVEDVAIGRGLYSFKPQRPRSFTVGRLSPISAFSRKVKELFIGMGYQEMIYNYLGSRKDLVERMRGDGAGIIRIANPMTENYAYLRDSILPSLLQSEAVSSHAAYPHRLFEIGKIARRDGNENYGTATRQYAGFLYAGEDAGFNTLAGQLQTLFYYLSREYQAETLEDSRFIPGRAAAVQYQGRAVGVFGELHPGVLENWGAVQPCAAGEIDLDALLEL
ncbi:MAG: phenylalanine--tRNA ligase subunit beta [Treponema sp.]|jgi:phenylalanyl-tRNA synthetase beta chain|nr:phenylalanine--tRNA ligase subunit beta [Treponema sp.]